MTFGYGNGTRTSHDDSARDNATGARVSGTFANGMVAHVWAQHSQTFGKSHNGNLFFRGRALYSYGRHYVAGLLLPDADTGEGVALALVNADRASVTTSGHLSDARRAVRGRVAIVPGLTTLADVWERAERAAAYDVDVWPHVRKAWDAAAYRAALLPGLRSALARMNDTREHVASVADLFRAAGADNPDEEAAAIAAAVESRVAEEKAEEKARASARAAYRGREIARDWTPESMREAIRARAKEAAGRRNCDYQKGRDEEEARAAFRAAKALKAAGDVETAAKVTAVYKAIRESLPFYDAAARRAARLSTWRDKVADVRAGLAIPLAPSGVFKARGPSGESLLKRPDGRGVSSASYIFGRAAGAAANMADALNGADSWAKGPARIAGHDVDAMAARLEALGVRLSDLARQAHKAESREEARGAILAIKAARKLRAEWPTFPDGLPAGAFSSFDEVAAASATLDTAARYFKNRAPWAAYAGAPSRPLFKLESFWAVARFTPESFSPLAAFLSETRDALKSEADKAAARIKAREIAQAREIWREEGRTVKGGPRDAMGRLSCEKGGALLRAVDVVRDAAGEITGGTLSTSWGATVPLTHALRAFRFLLLCRAKGEADSTFDGWKANGKTIPVGHFRVDEVDSAGNMRAGCHRIMWPEVERLARTLGVDSLAPADTREERAHA